MPIPLETFELTGDPLIDDPDHLRLCEKPPKLTEWFGMNSRCLQYDAGHILSNGEPYKRRDGPANHGIYFLINENRIVYVGKALGIWMRLDQHAIQGKLFSHYWCFGGVPYDWLRHVEGFYINRFRPAYNLDHVIYNKALDLTGTKA